MAKGAYIGVNGEPRKVKKIYIGVNSEPRRVTKAYIGIGGIPRPCWGEGFGGAPTSYGTISSLYSMTAGHPGTVGNYVIFPSTYEYNYGDGTAYDSSLTRYSMSQCIGSSSNPVVSGMAYASTPDGNHAIYYGGTYGTDEEFFDTVYYCDSSLSFGYRYSQSQSCAHATGATTSKNAVFAGGYNSDFGGYLNICELYNNSLTASTHSTEDLAYVGMSGVSCGTHGAWFAGGGNTSVVRSEVWAVQDKQGDSYYVGDLDEARGNLGGTKVGSHVIFGGGYLRNGLTKKTEGFSLSGTKINSCADLSHNYFGDTQVTTLGDYALFTGGGANSTGSYSSSSNVVEVYDSSLTKQASITITQGSGSIVANGKYAFAAGRGSDSKGVSVITLV